MPGPDSTPNQPARYGLLSEIVLLIARSPDLSALLPKLVRQVKWLLDFDRCTLAIANNDGQTYRLETLLETRPQVKAMGRAIDLVVGIESRGFILGAAVADRLGAGFVPVRKLGKLPAATVRARYDLEYGSDSLEMHEDAIEAGQRVAIVDDLLATGGTSKATVDLVKRLGGTVEGLAFLIELVELNGRQRLAGENLFTVLQY